LEYLGCPPHLLGRRHEDAAVVTSRREDARGRHSLFPRGRRAVLKKNAICLDTIPSQLVGDDRGLGRSGVSRLGASRHDDD
jgi:hypothetical protein